MFKPGFGERNVGRSGADVPCGGNCRHWYTGPVGLKLPFCSRCGAVRPRPLSEEEMAEARDWISHRESKRMAYLLDRSTEDDK